MNDTPWTKPVTHVALEEDSAAAQRWAAFHAWYEDLVKWVQAPGQEETGHLPHDAEKDAWLWVVGLNIRLEHTRAEISDRLATMPEFPTEWPEGQSTDTIVERLSALAALSPVPASHPYPDFALSWHLKRYADRVANGKARVI